MKLPCFQFLLVSCLYGILPQKILTTFLAFDVASVDLKHIFRGVMGLYIGLGVFWALASRRTAWHSAGITSVILFMAGLAGGRVLSMVVDGVPSLLLVVYFFVEVAMAVGGVYLLRKP